MSVAADIILIITAIQSNGNLSYTLNVFKTKTFLKKHSTCHTFWELVATVQKIYQQSEIAKPTEGRNDMHIRYTKEKLMRRQNECECEGQISCARAGVNEVRMCRSKWNARAQVRMRSPVRRPKYHAHAQLQMRYASAGQKKMRMHMPKWNAHAQD